MLPDDPATPGDDVDLDELERLANEYEAAMTNEANEDLTRKQWVEAVVWAGEQLADAVRSSAAGFRALTADRDAHRAAAQEAEAERDALRRAVEDILVGTDAPDYAAKGCEYPERMFEIWEDAQNDLLEKLSAALASAASPPDAGTPQAPPP